MSIWVVSFFLSLFWGNRTYMYIHTYMMRRRRGGKKKGGMVNFPLALNVSGMTIVSSDD